MVFFWTGPDWTGLDRTGPDWTGLDRTGPDWTGLDRTGPDWTGERMKSPPPPQRFNLGQHFSFKDFTFFRRHMEEPDRRGGGL
jgi:hypothetical protein